MQITLWKTSIFCWKNGINEKWEIWILESKMNQIFGTLCGKTEDFFTWKFKLIDNNILAKLNFWTKIRLLPQCVDGQPRKEKSQTFAEKVAQTAIFDIVSQCILLRALNSPFSRILAMVLKDVEHQSWRWRRERISVIKYCKSCQQPLLWGGLKFPSSRTPKDEMMMLCELRQAEGQEGGRLTYFRTFTSIVSSFYIHLIHTRKTPTRCRQ